MLAAPLAFASHCLFTAEYRVPNGPAPERRFHIASYTLNLHAHFFQCARCSQHHKTIPNSGPMPFSSRRRQHHLCRSLLICPSSLLGNPPTLSALLITSLPFAPSRSSIGNPHHSRWNLSCSIRLASFFSRSTCRFNLVANHSSRAASCSACVACLTMQLFIARFWSRHLKGAVKVRPRAQSANTTH